MRLIVGLGNPGSKYQGTRHNVGFDVVERLAAEFGQGRPKEKFQGQIVEAQIDGQKAVLLRPLTYMNRSGMSVQRTCDFYKLDHSQLLIICDDFHLPLARLRFRARGSSGGQKGMADIIRQLGTEELARLRIGIGPPPPGWDVADYVLSRFAAEESEAICDAIRRASEAVRDWSNEGIESCMNRYNAG